MSLAQDKNILPLPSYFSIQLGCDPELFLTKEVGKTRKRQSVVGSELVVPEGGIPVGSGMGRIVRDGVQVEFQPISGSCRANMSNHLSLCFQELQRRVEKYPGLKIDFSQTVRLSAGDMARLHPDSRQLNCGASLNIYGRRPIYKNGEKFRMRSGAGHIHIGSEALTDKYVNPENLVKILDVLIGNTCVMLDRDPLAAERRKTYGRAGEYRLPKHGLEYRTLSNFWLKAYPLFSLVMALSRISAKVAFSSACKKKHEEQVRSYRKQGYPPYNWPTLQIAMYDAEERLMNGIDMSLVEKAINTNDFDLAQGIYNAHTRPFLAQVQSNEGLSYASLDKFDYFVKKGIDFWFTKDPLSHWLTKGDGHGTGWEIFRDSKITEVMQKDKITEMQKEMC
jgi:hypothetical protein